MNEEEEKQNVRTGRFSSQTPSFVKLENSFLKTTVISAHPSRESQFLSLYSSRQLLVRIPDTRNLLLKTKVNENVRTRMVDWMLEVLTILGGLPRFHPQTYFRAVLLADLYYKHCSETIEDRHVHLIGVACMYIASKYEDDPPFSIFDFCFQAARNEFNAGELREQEFKILATLGFYVAFPTMFEVFEFYFSMVADGVPTSFQKHCSESVIFVLMICVRITKISELDSRFVVAAALLLAFRHILVTELIMQSAAKRAIAKLLNEFSKEEEKLGQITRFVRRSVRRFLKIPEDGSHILSVFSFSSHDFK